MSGFDKTIPEDFDIQKAIKEILDAPEWHGFTAMNLGKIKRFVEASRIFEMLFVTDNVTKVLTEPRPFHEDCGGTANIFCDTAPYAFAVFQNREAITLVSRFLKLVDSVSVTAERSMTGETVIVINWSIFGVSQK